MAQQPAQSPSPGGADSNLQSLLSGGGAGGGQQQPGGMTGIHILASFNGKPDHGLKPAHMGHFTNAAMPKTPGMPKFGGGINKNAKPLDMKKSGYTPAPGQAEHVKQGGAEHVNPQKAEHVSQQMRHFNSMGIGGETNFPAFAGLNPFQGMSSPFQGMSLYAGRMSPHAMPNFAPITTVFNAPDLNSGANRAYSAQQAVSAAQAAQAAQSRGQGR